MSVTRNQARINRAAFASAAALASAATDDFKPFVCRHRDPRCVDDPCPAGISWLCEERDTPPATNTEG